MAQLGDLIVSGKSRFLNTINTSEIDLTTDSTHYGSITPTKIKYQDGTYNQTELTGNKLEIKTNQNSTTVTPSTLEISSSTKKLTIVANDITKTNDTWDGTNTSLVTAVTSAKDTVKQHINSTNAALDVILSGSASGGATGTGYVYKSSNLTFNPAYSNATMTSGLLCVNGKSTSNVNYSLKMYSNDIVLSGTSSTWDGTNTSLVTAVTQLKNNKADILAETIASLTFSSGVATLAKKTGYILINIYPYNRSDNIYGITSFTEQTDGSYKIRNNTTNLSASLAARAIWLKV